MRMPGFVKDDGRVNLDLLKDGTEEGLFTLMGWMDDCKEALLAEKYIAGTDLFLQEESAVYSLYTDQNYAKDTRPIYYGFINAVFQCYADDGDHSALNDYLK